MLRRRELAPRVYIPLQNLEATHLIKPGQRRALSRLREVSGSIDVEDESPLFCRRFNVSDSSSTRSKNGKKIWAKHWKIFTAFSISSVLFLCSSARSAWRARFKRTCNKRQQPARFCAVWARRRGRLFSSIFCKPRRWVWPEQLPAADWEWRFNVCFRAFCNHSSLFDSRHNLLATDYARCPDRIRDLHSLCVALAIAFRRVSPLLVLARVGGLAVGAARSGVVVHLCFDGHRRYGIRDFAIGIVETGLLFAAALGVAIGIFAGVAKLLMIGVRKLFPHRGSFVLRQGLANLYRPDNRTLLLTLSLGLGTFLLLNLYLTREVLLTQFRSIDANDQPNIFLFDIQPDQKEAVAELVRSARFPIIQEAPIVTMRLVEIKGRKTTDILADPQHKIPEWELEREYRSTYREHLTETEKITDGHWIGRVDYHPGRRCPDFARQGNRERSSARRSATSWSSMCRASRSKRRSRVCAKSIGNVFRQISLSSFRGVLENAPDFQCARQSRCDAGRFRAVAKCGRREISQCLRARSVLRHSNRRINSEQSRARHSHHVALHRRRRIDRAREHDLERTLSTFERESILLRTLGASRAQIWKILCAEYFFLGGWPARPEFCWRSFELGAGDVCF